MRKAVASAFSSLFIIAIQLEVKFLTETSLLNFNSNLSCCFLIWSESNQGSIPRLGRSSGEGNGNPLQYSCLESPMDREA